MFGDTDKKRTILVVDDELDTLSLLTEFLTENNFRIISTDDPLKIPTGGVIIKMDLGAERVIAAQKGSEKIAVEIKSFLSDSAVFDFHLALGQFLNYRLVLEATEPERILYLAVPNYAYQSFFHRDLPQAAIKKYLIKIMVYDPINQEDIEWIN